MNPKERLADDDAGRFRTTHWISLSAQNQMHGLRATLAEVCRYPLSAFVQRWGPSAEDALDLTQALLRKPYDGLLRVEIARAVADPHAIGEEVYALCEALVASKGRFGP
jgi:hypothetical protein